MLKERIRTDCGNGDNCSQVILRAVAEEYGISLSEELFCACRGIHGGFGINGMCSGIVAGVMALGLLCEEELKLKRILFLLRDRRIKGRKQSQLLPGFLLEHMQG